MYRRMSTEIGEESSNGETVDGQFAQPAVPKINCQEKIILCLDLSCEIGAVPLRNSSESTFTLLQKALDVFVKSKVALNKKHMFAIVTLEDSAHWLQEFSCDVNLICDTLHQLSPSNTEMYQTFDMTSLFEIIESHVELPKVDDIELPPPSVFRVLMIYGRSHSALPSISSEGKQIFDKYMASPYFFLDVLYVHEIPDQDNNCEAIYEAFCKMDDSEVCFMLEVSHSLTRLCDHTAKLLAHPLQRPRQQDMEHRFIECNPNDEPIL